MKATLTLKIKLETTEAVFALSFRDSEVYVVALNHTSQLAFEKKVFNSVALHHITYQDMRALTKLRPISFALPAMWWRRPINGTKKTSPLKQTAAMRYDAAL